ncbi:NitT/TauT family transport system permease protein [Amaricoccus macauensis]|uniref:NitT/TauT family transport system permease protein n=1 Tax=Amaricoccus macauensis TaxID=57001 RepID=A0A840SWP3_9RHOB|nr:ABC transporter permease [Amaricoccus macauensis]MBB5223663.1 NitT/TauT family transport system permease protein [Amaricoccus macauensis]
MASNAAPGDFAPVIRAEYERTDLGDAKLEDVQRKLPLAETLWNSAAFRKTLILLGLAMIWQIYGVWLDNPMIFPTMGETLSALLSNIANGTIPVRLLATLKVLVVGYVIGVILATVFTTIAVSSRLGTDLLSTLTAMFNPLPAIALLPLALLWFGLGTPSLVFVIVNSVLWAVALNMHTGFLTVSETMRMAGQTFGLRGMRYVVQLLIPAAFPAILAGLKIGWAFAWRTLIAAELVFGVSSGQGGLGWFIFENRNLLDTPAVFAGLLTVMAVGLFVEGVIFRFIENRTVRKWGMQRG